MSNRAFIIWLTCIFVSTSTLGSYIILEQKETIKVLRAQRDFFAEKCIPEREGDISTQAITHGTIECSLLRRSGHGRRTVVERKTM